MTQCIVIQVGQCGNQIGHRFWNLALQEHASVSQKCVYDDAMSTFFHNGASVSGGYLEQISGLKARAVLVDMEEGVVGELFKGRLRNLYDNRFLITDVSGSGNNWAVGNCFYGRKHHEQLTDSVRKAAELCDYLQCFFLIHSLGGGTGSGIGTHILQMLQDEFPDVYRLVTAVFPSIDDDVITSPYNTVLGMNRLTELADCVFPIDNGALANITNRTKESCTDKTRTVNGSTVSIPLEAPVKHNLNLSKSRPFDEMNNIVASMLLNLTSSSRFEGTMNVDLSEISMNLVPFPKIHYLTAAQSPATTFNKFSTVRKLDQVFSDAFTRDLQLFSADPQRHTFLASALLLRGDVSASEIRSNIERLQHRLRFIPWNRDGWKVGHCSVPPVGQPYSLLALSNNTAVREGFSLVLERFNKLYRRKAHLHHYETVAGFDSSLFQTSADSLAELLTAYETFEQQALDQSVPSFPRLQIAE